MNLDDLKETWKLRHSEQADSRFDELASRVLTRASCFEKKILRRDLIETAAAIIVIVAFGYFLLQNIYPLTAQLGMVIIVLGTIEIVVVLHWTRRWGDRPHHDLPLTGYCAEEIARVDRQIRLLRNVNWWYTGPPLLGACVFFIGLLFSEPLPLPIVLPLFAVLCVPILIFGWMIYRINQRAVFQELIPLREELSAIYASLMDDPTKPEGTKQ